MLNNKVYGEFPRGQVLPGLVVPRLFLSLVNVFTSPGKYVSGTVGLKANTVLGLPGCETQTSLMLGFHWLFILSSSI